MKRIIHARDDDALRNGSYIHQRLGKQKSTFAQVMNGDFIGWLQQLPPDLKAYSLREARKLMPKNCG